MSRLEANGDQSMEEILASIRKIIAEDAPASRPQSHPSRTTSTPAPQRGFMSRESFIRSPAPSAPEPKAESNETYFSPIVPQNAPAETPSDAAARPDASTAVSRPREDAAAQPLVPVSGKPDVGGRRSHTDDVAADHEAKDEDNEIEAQLAGLLADDLEALATHAGSAAAVQGEKAKSTAPVDVPKSTGESEVRTANASDPLPVAGREANDPFSFDLGPSPFVANAPEPAAADARPPSTIAASLDSLERSISNMRDFANRDAQSPRPATPINANAPEAATSPAPSRRDPLAVPSVAATLGPYSTLEPLSASFDPPSPSSERPAQAAFSRPVSPSSTHVPTASAPLIAAPQPHSANGRAGMSFPSTIVPGSDPDRALEDTVADLLRPMLKTWLAENMPKIVERALRREINERLLLGQKNAAE